MVSDCPHSGEFEVAKLNIPYEINLEKKGLANIVIEETKVEWKVPIEEFVLSIRPGLTRETIKYLMEQYEMSEISANKVVDYIGRQPFSKKDL